MSKAPAPPDAKPAKAAEAAAKTPRQREKVNPKDIQRIWNECKTELQKVIIGKVEIMEDIMITLLAGGHVLLEGVPGIAKTVITKAFADVIGLEFNRQQFTPDALPSDVLGTNIYDPKTGSFKLRRGPVFCNFLLADEINRSPPKTQAAMLSDPRLVSYEALMGQKIVVLRLREQASTRHRRRDGRSRCSMRTSTPCSRRATSSVCPTRGCAGPSFCPL